MHNLEADLSGLRGAHNALKADHERLKSAYDKLAPDFTDVKRRLESLTTLALPYSMSTLESFLNPSSLSITIEEKSYLYK